MMGSAPTGMTWPLVDLGFYYLYSDKKHVKFSKKRDIETDARLFEEADQDMDGLLSEAEATSFYAKHPYYNAVEGANAADRASELISSTGVDGKVNFKQLRDWRWPDMRSEIYPEDLLYEAGRSAMGIPAEGYPVSELTAELS